MIFKVILPLVLLLSYLPYLPACVSTVWTVFKCPEKSLHSPTSITFRTEWPPSSDSVLKSSLVFQQDPRQMLLFLGDFPPGVPLRALQRAHFPFLMTLTAGPFIPR